MKRGLVLLLLVSTVIASFAQSSSRKMSRQQYIEMYKDIAIRKMHEYGIPASITLAQGILESDNGNSFLATKANNHFGIKCHNDWNGPGVRYDDDKKNECFRKYRNPEESFKDHSLFLTQRSRYAFLFDLKPTDYRAWARGLKKAGYATNPRYAELLIKIIEENQLYLYDQGNPDIPGPVIAVPGLFASGYQFPDPDNYIHLSTLSSGRNTYANNGKEFVFVEQGDTFLKLSMELGIEVGKLQKYNDLKNSDKLYAGQMLYLEKKKRRASEKFHYADELDTPFSIAMEYGVRLKSLKWKNRIREGQGFRKGQKIWLKRRKPVN
jgi:hypothetical protein